MKLNYDRGNYTTLNQSIQQKVWDETVQSQEVDGMYSELVTTLEIRDQHIPSQIIAGDHSRKPYRLSLQEQNAIKNKHRK